MSACGVGVDSYVTLERYSSHTEGDYLFSLCKPHVEGIWVFALVCLDIQELCKLYVLLETVVVR